MSAWERFWRYWSRFIATLFGAIIIAMLTLARYGVVGIGDEYWFEVIIVVILASSVWLVADRYKKRR